MKFKIHKYYPEAIGSIICLTFGMLSGYSVKTSHSLWYASLNKPSFHPSPWIFCPVWTILYVMMGFALGMLWKDKVKNERLILIFIAQFILNVLWSPIFFYYQNIGLALLDIGALWVLLIVFMFTARNQRPLLLLFCPYFLWVSFALILSFTIYHMNTM